MTSRCRDESVIHGATVDPALAGLIQKPLPGPGRERQRGLAESLREKCYDDVRGRSVRRREAREDRVCLDQDVGRGAPVPLGVEQLNKPAGITYPSPIA